MSLQHQKAATRGICPRCGKSYTEGRERDHHCGEQIGETRLAPPGVIVESYRLAMGLPPAKDAPANVRASVSRPAGSVSSVSTPVSKSVSTAANTTIAPCDGDGEEVATQPVGDKKEARKAYQRELMRERRAAEKASNGAAAD